MFVQAPRSDVYVAMLGVALVSMIVGCLLLVLVLKNYDFKTKAAAIGTPTSSMAIAQLGVSENSFSVRL